MGDHLVYVRMTNKPVAQTSVWGDPVEGFDVHVDRDAEGAIVGVEFIGAEEVTVDGEPYW